MKLTQSTSRTSPAERLVHLEREDERLSKLLHKQTLQRAKNRDEALRIRTSFTASDRALYETLRTMKPRKNGNV